MASHPVPGGLPQLIGTPAAVQIRHEVPQPYLRGLPQPGCWNRLQHTALARGELVLCDRYTASSLVLQAGLDEVPESFVRELNRFAEPPDLQVVLTAPGEELRARLAVRGSHGRFEDDPTGVTREIALYERLSAQLTREGLVVEVVDTSPGVEEVVSHLAGLIGALWSQGRAAV
ncbi:dTMP kinase [Nocardiopsis sp. NPDC101807]|uniref:dTMP kinase n=1 Tax=Nocardiopsis sp. NPDC101807 TaxID=3364339 RepID=UPI0038070CF0